jgi:hypothetical protein
MAIRIAAHLANGETPSLHALYREYHTSHRFSSMPTLGMPCQNKVA